MSDGVNTAKEVSRLRAEGRTDDAWRVLLTAARDFDDYAGIQALCRARRKLAAVAPPPAMPASARIALLGGATTATLEAPLQLALEAAGVSPTVHVSDYGAFAREALDPSSGTAAFRPDVAVLVLTPWNTPTWPAWNAGRDAVTSVVDEVTQYWLGLCDALHRNAGCDVVLSTFHALPARPFGAAGARLPAEANRFLAQVNDRLAERAPPFVSLFDVAALAAMHGTRNWVDPRFWYHARQPVSFECLGAWVRGLAGMLAAQFGRAAKCVVVDLDNTLWGGVVGDDGAAALHLGDGDPEGEAFVAFQRYLRSLKDRGLMLAVCSKNDEAQARTPFEQRPEMVLRPDDFVAFVANWRPKSDNLRAIAAGLNIGLDAMVFVDDNPAEREQVRQALPEVRVVEMGDDPAGYVRALDRTGWLDVVTLSAEDAGRTAMYAADAARRAEQATVADYDAYLRSLDQRAIIAPFQERHLDRITQLTNKTNQFNLTTLRLSRSELAAMMTSADHLTATVRLTDRFGDNGLISVLAARTKGDDLHVELWLMSCRVLNRGVEQLLMNHLAARAREAGCRTVHGRYVPTERNSLVKGHYEALGFAPRGERDGALHFTLALDAWRPFETSITLVDDD